MPPVNFVYNPSPEYIGVQDQIFGLIREHLSEASTTHNERLDGALNFGLHIRVGRGELAVPMPIDVFMSHGLADKNYLRTRTTQGRPLINSYGHVLVPGEYFRERLLERRRTWRRSKRVRLSPDQIHVVGWPRLDRAFRDLDEGRSTSHDGPLRVLWAPSHDQSPVGPNRVSLSSYPAFEQHLPRLRELFDVDISLHPANRDERTPTSDDQLAWADVVISDFGTLLYEAWALDKTVVMPTWLMPEEMNHLGNAESRIYKERIGNHAGSIDELIEMVTAHEPPDRRVREFMSHHLDPAFRGRSAERIASLLTELTPERPTWWRRVRP